MTNYKVASQAELSELAQDYIRAHELCSCGQRMLVLGAMGGQASRQAVSIEGRAHALVEVLCQIRYEFGLGEFLDAGALRVMSQHDDACIGVYPI
jgi:hypothetical protein